MNVTQIILLLFISLVALIYLAVSTASLMTNKTMDLGPLSHPVLLTFAGTIAFVSILMMIFSTINSVKLQKQLEGKGIPQYEQVMEPVYRLKP